MIAQAAFWVLAGGLVLTALGVIAARDLVRAAIAMVAHFVIAAALYVLLAAPFVAVVQLVVYAGAVMVLFVFVIMIVGDRATAPVGRGGRGWVVAVAAVGVLAGALVRAAAGGVPAAGVLEGPVAEPPSGFGSPGAFGELLFRDHVLELELVSVLLLVAMIGAVVLARHDRTGGAPAPDASQERE